MVLIGAIVLLIWSHRSGSAVPTASALPHWGKSFPRKWISSQQYHRNHTQKRDFYGRSLIQHSCWIKSTKPSFEYPCTYGQPRLIPDSASRRFLDAVSKFLTVLYSSNGARTVQSCKLAWAMIDPPPRCASTEGSLLSSSEGVPSQCINNLKSRLLFRFGRREEASDKFTGEHKLGESTFRRSYCT